MSEVAHNKAVRQISASLKGPVAAVFRALVPAFGDLDGNDFYEAVVGSSELLHGCMLIFRKRRSAFAHLLVDAQGRPVSDDFVALRCGRSVHDIIAMIVRTHAKNHFRAVLGGDPNDPKSKSGRLYRAMNEYLIHEWQVPLVPHYAPMPVAKARELGPMLLDLKSAAEVDAVVGARRAEVVPPEATASAANANAVPPPRLSKIELPEIALVEDHSRERDFWWETLNDPLVRQAMGAMGEAEMRELTAAFCALGDSTRANLLAPMGLSLYQAAVLLGTCYRNLGRAGFGQIFGKPGSAGAVAAFAGKLKARQVSSRTNLRELAKAATAVLAAMPRPRPAAKLAAAQ